MAKNSREISFHIILNALSIKYQRKVYTFFDALGDAGGLLEAVMIITGVIVSPFYY